MNLDPTIAFDGVNALTIDVEEHFQANALADRFARTEWARLPYRTEANVERILALLAEHDTRATFFMLGSLADRFPEVVRRIVASGHELASYGYERSPAAERGDGPFLADIRLAKAVLEDISGEEVKGFRAPGYPIGIMNAWAFECIHAAGYRYNANGYVSRQNPAPSQGIEGVAQEVRPGLLDLPVATFRTLGSKWRPGAGDAFRQQPYWLSRRLLMLIRAKGTGAVTFHIRAWEIEPELPQPSEASGRAGPLGGGNVAPMEPRIRGLLADFRWDRVDRLFLS